MNHEMNLIFNETPEGATLTVLQGQAAAPVVRNTLHIHGSIDAPLEFLKKRKIDFNHSHLTVDRDTMVIGLIMNDHVDPSDVVLGKLQFTTEFLSWKINTGEGRNSRELSEFIKFNRSAFESKDTAMKLSVLLQNLKVSVEKKLEDKDDKKGNVLFLRQQIVKEMNIPENFRVKIQVFKGGPKVEFEIECYINAENFQVVLVSPEAADLVKSAKDHEIDRVVAEIRVICPDLAIMEI